MRPDRQTNDQEVESAWDLYDALHQLADRIWQRYEKPFTIRCMQELEAPPEESLEPLSLGDDDIPF